MQQGKTGIPQLQNTEASKTLLRAAFTSHRRAQRLQAVRTWLSLAVAGMAIVAAVKPSTAEAASVIGGIWALAYAATVNVSLNETRRAATLQEMFDVAIFRLPWNSMAAGHRIEHHEVSRLARRYRGPEDRLVNYYDIPALPRPFDVLACQHQNLAWGARVRARYGTLLTIALIGWSSLGLVLAAAAGLTVSQLILAWFIPSLGGLMMGVDLHREQHEVIEIRTRALHLANERIANALQRQDTEPDRGLEEFARQVQDAILATRQDQVRAPEWFFRCFQRSDRTDFELSMARRFERLTGPIEEPS
jgi:hypothetical protein